MLNGRHEAQTQGIPVKPMNLTLAPLSIQSIDAGKLFFHRLNAGAGAALAIKLQGLQLNWAWLNLNSNVAFSYQEQSSINSHKTVIPVSHPQIGAFMVDPDSVSAESPIKHGQLAINSDGAGIIAASTIGSTDATIGISLGSWSLTPVPSTPLVIFDRWSLGFFDGANQWVEVFRKQ
jgi:hypothetical protein